MFNDPTVNSIITIQGKTYQFTGVPETPDIVYAELGKKAKVYRVLQRDKAYALKVFKAAYRSSKLMKNSGQISRYQKTPGLAVAERISLLPEQFPSLITDHPEFSYAILMPWIEGKSWANYIGSKTALSRSESLRLANSFAQVIGGLEAQNLAHCDLSGGNFIFSTDFTHVELVDIEELYAPDLQEPDPIPVGTGGYSPDWAGKNGLWAPDGDRFAGAILICEILGWQFQDIRSAASQGDTFFAEGELGRKSKRFGLLEKRLEEIEPKLATLFRTVWQAETASDCPAISEWMDALNRIPESASPLNWGWESLDLPVDVAVPENTVKPLALPEEMPQPEEFKPVAIESSIQHQTPNEAVFESAGKADLESVVQPWPVRGKSRRDLLVRIFALFGMVGIIMCLLILALGGTIEEVSHTLREQNGLLLVDMVSNSILGLAVGSVQAWIFRNNIRKSHLGFFILASMLGGAAGGATAGLLTDIHYINNPYISGAVIGCVGGCLSSLGQNLFMSSHGLQIKWFLFSLLSWFVIWMIGTPISWSNETIPGLAGAAALIIIANGAALSLFLHQYPEVEF